MTWLNFCRFVKSGYSMIPFCCRNSLALWIILLDIENTSATFLNDQEFGTKVRICNRLEELFTFLDALHKVVTVSAHPFLLWGTTFRPKFWKGKYQKKKSTWGYLKSSCHGYLPVEAYYVPCQKKTFKNKISLWGLKDLGQF